jgi:hypothetical protein
VAADPIYLLHAWDALCAALRDSPMASELDALGDADAIPEAARLRVAEMALTLAVARSPSDWSGTVAPLANVILANGIRQSLDADADDDELAALV